MRNLLMLLALASGMLARAEVSARPDDFDAFWDARLDALADVPMDAVMLLGNVPPEQIPAGLVYTQFSLAVSPAQRVRGQLAHPNRPGERFPALVTFQWAGVYPLSPFFVTGPAAEGWLCVNVSAHDLPIDEPAAFYNERVAGPLKNYWSLGADDREGSYFLRMFLGTRRALDFVREHPAWDGRILVVQGTSQGATQALVAAALEPRVTAVLANVPALSDHHAEQFGRPAGFPFWLNQVEDRDPGAVANAALYYDLVHFAPRIKAPVLLSAGERDTVCPPQGITRVARALAGPVEFILMPDTDHPGANDPQTAYHLRAKIWLDQLRTHGVVTLTP